MCVCVCQCQCGARSTLALGTCQAQIFRGRVRHLQPLNGLHVGVQVEDGQALRGRRRQALHLGSILRQAVRHLPVLQVGSSLGDHAPLQRLAAVADAQIVAVVLSEAAIPARVAGVVDDSSERQLAQRLAGACGSLDRGVHSVRREALAQRPLVLLLFHYVALLPARGRRLLLRSTSLAACAAAASATAAAPRMAAAAAAATSRPSPPPPP